MTNFRRVAFPLLLVLSVLGAVAVVVVYVLSFQGLESGPSLVGYDQLNLANSSLPWVAVVVVLTVFMRVRMNRVRFAVGGLALASGIVGAVAAGVWTLGAALANFQPTLQTPELNSLLLAIWGTGQVVAPTAVVLAAGAALLAGVGAFTRWISLESYDRAVEKRAAASAQVLR